MADTNGTGLRQTEGAPRLDDLMKQNLRGTGADVPPGSYGATLIGYGEPFMMPISEKFKKAGQPEKRPVFEARFALYIEESGEKKIVELEYLMPVPDGGAANRKSNLFKVLKALGTNDAKLMKADGSGFATSEVKLGDFVGKTCVLSVKKNDKDWPSVESVGAPMKGILCPPLEEAKKALGGDAPF